jgi:hypothetical protein
MWLSSLITFACVQLSAAVSCTVGPAQRFDPNQRYIVVMKSRPSELQPSVELMTDMCDFMVSQKHFVCNTVWTDGFAGYLLSEGSLVPKIQDELGKLYENVTYEVFNDSFFEYPSGMRSAVPKVPKCINITLSSSNVTSYIIDDGDAAGSHASHVVMTGAKLRFVSVRKMREDGWVSDLIAGLDRVAKHNDTPALALIPMVVKVAAAPSVLVVEYVRRVMAAGIVVISAAGNGASDACDYVPPAMDSVVTVGALRNGSTWEMSNYGRCVDVWGPGDTEKMYVGTAQAAGLVAALIAPILRRGMQARDVMRVLGNLSDALILKPQNA